RMTPDGALANVHTFAGGLDGGNVIAPLIPGNDGNLYGASQSGGAAGFGNTFRLNSDGTITALYSFTNGVDGASPTGALVQASDGNFYGTTPGGTFGFGNIYRMTPAGALATIYSFRGGSDGYAPQGAL